MCSLLMREVRIHVSFICALQFEVYLSEDGHVCANMEGTDIVTISPQGSVFLDTGGRHSHCQHYWYCLVAVARWLMLA